jgi:hypothetical protein
MAAAGAGSRYKAHVGTEFRRVSAGSSCGTMREWGKQWPEGRPEEHEEVSPGEAEFQVEQGSASAACGATTSSHDGAGEMRSAVDANPGWG